MVNRLQVLREGIEGIKRTRDRTSDVKEVMIVFEDNTQVVKPVKQVLQTQIGEEHLLTIVVRIN